MVELPLYIQKYIIKIICKYINSNNKIIDIIGVSTLYRRNESMIKKLMINIALVNHEWFKTLSNNLRVAVDFNYKLDFSLTEQYSIIKRENIKFLKLHFNHEIDSFYNKANADEIPIKLDFIKENLKNLSTLTTSTTTTTTTTESVTSPENNIAFKKFILRNVRVESNSLNILINSLFDVFDGKLYCGESINALALEINNGTTLSSLNQLCTLKLRKIFTIYIDGCDDENIVLETFKLFSKSIRHFYLLTLTKRYPLIQLLTGTIKSVNYSNCINYLSNIEFINIYNSEMTLQDIICLISPKNLPKLKYFAFNVCLNNLIFYLSTKEERLENFNIRKCHCGSVISPTIATTTVDDSEEEKIQNQFQLHWNEILNILKVDKKMKQLELSHECNGSSGPLFIGDDSKLPLSFIASVTTLISSIENLEKLITTGIFSPTFFETIIKANKSITQFESTVLYKITAKFIDQKPFDFIQYYSHIKQFKFLQHENTLFNYEFDYL